MFGKITKPQITITEKITFHRLGKTKPGNLLGTHRTDQIQASKFFILILLTFSLDGRQHENANLYIFF